MDVALYSEDCLFADDIASFKGRDRFVANLANLGALVDQVGDVSKFDSSMPRPRAKKRVWRRASSRRLGALSRALSRSLALSAHACSHPRHLRDPSRHASAPPRGASGVDAAWATMGSGGALGARARARRVRSAPARAARGARTARSGRREGGSWRGGRRRRGGGAGVGRVDRRRHRRVRPLHADWPLPRQASPQASLAAGIHAAPASPAAPVPPPWKPLPPSPRSPPSPPAAGISGTC